MKYERPKLKTPPPPKTAVMDLDAPLFAAASAGEQVVYSAVDDSGKVVAKFNSAKAYEGWLSELEIFGFDTQFGFNGAVDNLQREVHHELKDFKEATKAFDSIINKWFKKSGCEDWFGYVSKATGEKNFRYAIATLAPYKGARPGTRKPAYLEELREYALMNPNIRKGTGNVEVDDWVCAKSQKLGWRGCMASHDKDGRGVNNTHIFIPDEMDKPQFSSSKILGHIGLTPKGKLTGYGTLFWLGQCIAGDQVDGIPGCIKRGPVVAMKTLEQFSGVSSIHLQDAVAATGEVFRGTYGDSYTYNHCTTGERIEASWKDLFMEMSQLVYMKRGKNDICFWLPVIEELK